MLLQWFEASDQTSSAEFPSREGKKRFTPPIYNDHVANRAPIATLEIVEAKARLMTVID